MRNKLSKILRSVLLLLLGFVNFIYAKAVHARIVYAPYEVFEKIWEREAKTKILFDFIREYIVLVIFVFLLAIVGLISIIRILLLKIFKKRKQDQNIQPQKPTDETSKQ